MLNKKTGKLNSTYQLKGATNKDWEAITQDTNYLYIGDFGNNRGNRKDLRIYKIAKLAIEQEEKAPKIDTIAFVYPDQKNFTGPIHQHNYDCEAMIAVGDSLYLFSKNFEDRHSKLYVLPKQAGSYTAHLKDRFNVKGNITDAAIGDTGVIALSGYYFDQGNFFPFLWLFWEYPDKSFFQGQAQRINFNFQAQMEGICYDQNGYFFLSSESSRHGKGQLFHFDSKKWTN